MHIYCVDNNLNQEKEKEKNTESKQRIDESHKLGVLRNTIGGGTNETHLASEAVEGASLAFQSIDDIHCCYRLAASMFSVSNSITNHVLQESLQDTSSFLVDGVADTFHSVIE